MHKFEDKYWYQLLIEDVEVSPGLIEASNYCCNILPGVFRLLQQVNRPLDDSDVLQLLLDKFDEGSLENKDQMKARAGVAFNIFFKKIMPELNSNVLICGHSSFFTHFFHKHV